MVDWKEDHASLFIPKNLSNEEYYPRHYVQSLLYDALQLCETSSAYKEYFANEQKAKLRVSIHQKRKRYCSYLKQKQARIVFGTSNDVVYALDLAVGRQKPRPKLSKRNVKMEAKWKSLDETVTNGQHDSQQLQEYKNLTPTSPTCLSESSTVFSDDYTQMTDVGSEMSDLDMQSVPSCCSDGDCDSTFTPSEISSISTVTSDLERVTIDFQNDISDKSEPGASANAIPNSEKDGKEKLKLMISDLFAKSLSVPADSDSKGGLYEDREFDFLKTENVKRSTSLKTYKTPPGTPSRKKAVRFADALGLDLEDVRHVLNLDDPPNIPASAMKDLKVGLEEAHKSEGTRYLSACFPQPSASPTFLKRVRDNKVVLENCIISDKDLTVMGTVRVANIAFHKQVNVRFTVNDWTTFTDIPASYVHNSNDGPTDRFSFTINVPAHFQVGSKLQMAVQYRAEAQEFWDSNNGRNYVIECYARAVPVSEADNTWLHFM